MLESFLRGIEIELNGCMEVVDAVDVGNGER